MQTVRLEEREPFITADGSTIRELAGVPSGNAVNQSLAQATVPPGGETVDTVVIAPGVPHKLWNPGEEDLVLLCCCAPPYSHDDTVLLEG